MYGCRTYAVIASQPYIDVVGMVAADVVVVDRNGIGVKTGTSFSGGSTETVSAVEYNWYGITKTTLSVLNNVILISEVVTTDRELTYKFGSSPVAGTTFSFWVGDDYIKYTVQAGDNTQDVRDAIKSAIDGYTWPATVTTTSISTHTLEVVITGATFTFDVYVGQQRWKRGRYCVINNVYYLINELTSTTANPTLPALAASYAYNDLIALTTDVETYLAQPLTRSVYDTSAAGSTDITGTPSNSGVTPGQCVLDEPNQRIWFDSNLNFGEIIKVFQK